MENLLELVTSNLKLTGDSRQESLGQGYSMHREEWAPNPGVSVAHQRKSTRFRMTGSKLSRTRSPGMSEIHVWGSSRVRLCLIFCSETMETTWRVLGRKNGIIRFVFSIKTRPREVKWKVVKLVRREVEKRGQVRNTGDLNVRGSGGMRNEEIWGETTM